MTCNTFTQKKLNLRLSYPPLSWGIVLYKHQKFTPPPLELVAQSKYYKQGGGGGGGGSCRSLFPTVPKRSGDHKGGGPQQSGVFLCTGAKVQIGTCPYS